MSETEFPDELYAHGIGRPAGESTALLSGRPTGSRLVSLRGVRRTYAAELAPIRALRGVDLEIGRGEFVALMGPSGCGKSTLLNIVAGLEQPDEGVVEVDGQRVDGRDDTWLARYRRHQVGIVFQFFNLIDGVSCLDNLVLPARIGGATKQAAGSRARGMLDLLGLGDKASAFPQVLSGGQRQRLAIARALVNEPAVLLADEPTGSLDSAGGAEILELFTRLHADGQTLMMVTHSPEVASVAGRVLRMSDGTISGEHLGAGVRPPR